MAKEKKLLFSLTKKDFVVEAFATGGPGGQHKNAKKNAIRITHPASGAIGQGLVHREQHKNREEAFINLTNSETFKAWHKTEVARRLGKPSEIDHEEVVRRVDEQMKHIKVETYDPILSS